MSIWLAVGLALLFLTASCASGSTSTVLAHVRADFLSSWGSNGAGPGEFDYTAWAWFGHKGIAVDELGFVYVVNQDRVQKFDSDGKFVLEWKVNLGTSCPSANWITINSKTAYVGAHRCWKVYSLTGDELGRLGKLLACDQTVGGIQGLAFDSKGRMWINAAENDGGQDLICRLRGDRFAGWFVDVSTPELKCAPNRSSLSHCRWGFRGGEEATYLDPGLFDTPMDIAVAVNGDVFVVAGPYGKGSVWRFNSSGAVKTTWEHLLNPYAITVDAKGRVYVADSGNHRIQVFTNKGESIGHWGELGSRPGQFRFPSGLAIGFSGDLYVVDSGNNRIQRFRIVEQSTP